jgi:hypothetical protein
MGEKKGGTKGTGEKSCIMRGMMLVQPACAWRLPISFRASLLLPLSVSDSKTAGDL